MIMKRQEFTIATTTGPETRVGYVCGGFAAHKEPGRGVYFWTFTDLESGMSINVYPPHETKAQALRYLTEQQADLQERVDRSRQAADRVRERAAERRAVRCAG